MLSHSHRTHAHAHTLIPGTRRITRTMKSHKGHAIDIRTPSSLIHREVIFRFHLIAYVYIYISLSLGTVLFENVYVDEASLRKTKGRG